MRHHLSMWQAAVVAAVSMVLGTSAQAALFDISGSTAQNAGSANPGSAAIDSSGVHDFELTTALSGAIFDINLRVSETGQFAQDIDITLIHNGVTVVIYDATTDGAGNMVATFDDGGTVTAPKTSTPIVGTFQPDSPLSAFNGVDLAGLWTLRFSDTIVPGDGDTLISWSIFGGFTAGAAAVPEPGTLALFGLGACALGGAVLRRRRARLTPPTK